MKRSKLRQVLIILVTGSMSFSSMSNAIQSTYKEKETAKEIINNNLNKAYFDLALMNSPYTSWGIDPKNSASINLTDAWKTFKKKKDVIVAVVDTGIDRTHPFLEKDIYVESGIVDDNNFGIDFSKDKKLKSAPIDTHGHGSHVSGIIKSIDPDVKILALKYFSPQASGLDNLNSTVEALRYAVDHNVDIINYSGGGPEPASEELKILKEAERKGILVVAASGNDESNIDDKAKAYYPASYGLKNIISVTAHDEDLKVLPSSNYGKISVDVAAPGQRIKSSLNNGRVGFLTGTSQATAFVTGVAALIKSEYPALSNEKIKEIIRNSAKKEKSLEGKCASGGRLDAANALSFAFKMSGDTLDNRRQLAQAQQTSKKSEESKKEGKIIYRINN
jgi:subtilisin family serine protease